MRVLLVHNFYGSDSPSGENKVVLEEKELLENYSFEVSTFYTYSDEIRSRGLIGKFVGAFSVILNISNMIRFRRKIQEFKPDIIHVHNTFPLISNFVFWFSNNIPIVLTTHNYRIFCAAGVLLREGSPCTVCMDKGSAISSIRYKCYRNSVFATIPLAVSISLHHIFNTWKSKVDGFLVFSDFQRQKFISAGIPENKIFVKPNFFNNRNSFIPAVKRGNYFVFVGRLSEEKGIRTLISAWNLLGENAPELKIVGDGPLFNELVSSTKMPQIKFIGRLSSANTQRLIANANALIFPSECYEGFPMVIREAFAFGTPVISSDLGPLPEINIEGKTGFIFKSASGSDLAAKIGDFYSIRTCQNKMYENAFSEFKEKYTSVRNIEILKKIYRKAIQSRMDKGGNR